MHVYILRILSSSICMFIYYVFYLQVYACLYITYFIFKYMHVYILRILSSNMCMFICYVFYFQVYACLYITYFIFKYMHVYILRILRSSKKTLNENTWKNHAWAYNLTKYECLSGKPCNSVLQWTHIISLLYNLFTITYIVHTVVVANINTMKSPFYFNFFACQAFNNMDTWKQREGAN